MDLCAKTTLRLILGTAVAVFLGLALTTVVGPHDENDELVYGALAQKLTLTPRDYSLAGTGVLSWLPAQQYDQPIFRHPPVFPYLLAALYLLFPARWGILLPVASGAALVCLGILVARRGGSLRTAGIAGAVLCCCPLVLFCSTKLWIDATFACLMVLAFHLFQVAYQRGSLGLVALAGVTLGLATLTKYPAVGILPAIAWHAFRSRTDARSFWRAMLVFTASAVATCVPWLLWHLAITGSLFRSQFAITEEYLRQYPFVRRSVQQPWYYYPRQIAAVAPVYLLGLPAVASSWRDTRTQVMLVWAATFIAVFTTLVLIGQLGYAVRYMLPAAVPLGILAADAIGNSPRRLLPIALVLLAYQIATGIMNSFVFRTADLFTPFAYLASLVRR